MKKQFLKYLLAVLLFAGTTIVAHSQVRIYVKVRPTSTVAKKPPMPHPHYVWIADEWKVKNGSYVHVPGYWVAPREGAVWVPGHWVRERRGEYWIPGHWRKV